MKSLKLLSLYIILALFTACKADELELWTANSRVWFTSKEPFIASFKKLPEESTELIAEVPISMAGSIAPTDREIHVDISKDKRNPLTRYEVVKPIVIPAGATKGVLKVKVYKTANLSAEADTINFAIRASANLDAGLVENIECIFVMLNKYTRPWWWYDFQLGLYTEEKHRVLFEVFDKDDDIRGAGTDPNFRRNWTGADALYNLYLLNKHCAEKGYSFRFQDGK